MINAPKPPDRARNDASSGLLRGKIGKLLYPSPGGAALKACTAVSFLTEGSTGPTGVVTPSLSRGKPFKYLGQIGAVGTGNPLNHGVFCRLAEAVNGDVGQLEQFVTTVGHARKDGDMPLHGLKKAARPLGHASEVDDKPRRGKAEDAPIGPCGP